MVFRVSVGDHLFCIDSAMATIAVHDNGPVPPFIPTTAGNINIAFNKLLLGIRCSEQLQLLHLFSPSIFHLFHENVSYLLVYFCISSQVAGKSTDLSSTAVSLIFSLFYFCGTEQKEEH